MLAQAGSDGSGANYQQWLEVLFQSYYSLLLHHSVYDYGMQQGVAHVPHPALPMHHLSLLVTRLCTGSTRSAHQHSQSKQDKGQK